MSTIDTLVTFGLKHTVDFTVWRRDVYIKNALKCKSNSCSQTRISGEATTDLSDTVAPDSSKPKRKLIKCHNMLGKRLPLYTELRKTDPRYEVQCQRMERIRESCRVFLTTGEVPLDETKDGRNDLVSVGGEAGLQGNQDTEKERRSDMIATTSLKGEKDKEKGKDSDADLHEKIGMEDDTDSDVDLNNEEEEEEELLPPYDRLVSKRAASAMAQRPEHGVGFLRT